MELIKKYRLIIAVVLPILILVLIKALVTTHFKSDVKKWAEPSVTRSNIITEKKAGLLAGEKLILNLDKKVRKNNGIQNDTLFVSPDSVLNKNYLNTIRKHNGPVLIFSSEISVSSRIWMILSQMGYMNIFILTNDTDNELFKNKFRPDTLVRPEL